MVQIQLEVDMVLYSGGRDANSERIGCENVGVKVGKYGRVQVTNNVLRYVLALL